MGTYLIDTNVVIDYLSAVLPEAGRLFMLKIINNTPKISVITQIEMLSWNTNVAKEQEILEFIADSVVLNIDNVIIELCAAIRKEKRTKLPDAIIAATALAYNYTLITRNEKDFNGINGLIIVNPHKI